MGPFNPVLPMSGYSTVRPLSDEELVEHNRKRDERNAENRRLGLLAIGRDVDGKPFAPSDQAEEERLRTADLRVPLGEAIAARHEVALRLVDKRDAASRAQAHLEAKTAELANLADRQKAAERSAAENLIERFRAGPQDAAISVEVEVPASHDLARYEVATAQQAYDVLTTEVAAAEHELRRAQQRVATCADDVLAAEGLREADECLALFAAAEEKRANLVAAGYARLRFTTTMRSAHDYRPPDRPPAASVDWQAYIDKLYDDPAAELSTSAPPSKRAWKRPTQ